MFKIFTIDKAQLQSFLSPDSIPTDLGGRLTHQHSKWLQKCFSRLTAPITLSPSFFKPPLPQTEEGNAVLRRPSGTSSVGNRHVHRNAYMLQRKLSYNACSGSTPPVKRVANGGNNCSNNGSRFVTSAKSGLVDGNLATNPNSQTKMTVGHFLNQFPRLSTECKTEFEINFKHATLDGSTNKFT